MRLQRAAVLYGCSAALALAALAPATALADNPGNPGHHYGQLSNPGHHYGQLKPHSKLPSPPPIIVASPPPVLNATPAAHAAAGATQAIRTPVDASSPATSGSIGAVADPAPRVIAVGIPAPSPEQANWLTVILLAVLLAAGVVALVILAGRGAYYLIKLAPPSLITMRLKTAFRPR